MKPFRIFLLLACLLMSMTAVTSAAMPDISADKTKFDPLTMTYELTGHVRVATSDRVITADHAKGTMTTMEVWADGNITLMQDDIVFKGSKLYVNGNAHNADITGGTTYERSTLLIKSDNANFNWDTKLADFSGHVKRTMDGESETFNHLVYNVMTGEFLTEE
ncbi:LptA/OstA family protein [Schwartzia sp. (in: firmicutes)]